MKKVVTKHTKRFLSAFIALCMMLVMTIVPVMAEGLTATDDPRESVMQISLGYEDDGGNYTPYKMGTCFLINDEYVLTNKHVVTLTDAQFEDFKAVFNTPDLATNDSHIQLRLHVNKDMTIPAKMHENVHSSDMDFAAVKLSQKIYDRKPVALGDSSTIAVKDKVYAMGYPENSIANKEYNTKDDVSTVGGEISKVTTTGSVDIIEHTATLNGGNSGGPLLNEANEVVGINSFITATDGVTTPRNYSIQINAIKAGLDTFGITYVSNAAPAPTVTEAPEPTETPVVTESTQEVAPVEAPTVDTSALAAAISDAEAEDTSKATEESAQALADSITAGKAVQNNASATQAEVDAATDSINDAINNLEVKAGPNMALIIGIIAAIVVVFAIVLVLVNSNAKKKRAASKRPTPPMPPTPPTGYAGSAPSNNGGYAPTAAPTAPEGAGETTLLNQGAGETTLLGGASGAYLIRKKNGEKIVINRQSFKIGKERRRVDYCVADNTTVSRLHCEIIKKGADYYVVDQNSANFTYVNGVQLSPSKETLLTDQSTLKLSDEEFEFHMS